MTSFALHQCSLFSETAEIYIGHLVVKYVNQLRVINSLYRTRVIRLVVVLCTIPEQTFYNNKQLSKTIY